MCPRSKKVFECDKITMEIVRQWDSATDAEKELGFFVAGSCCRKNVSKGKYVYRYEDDYDPNESFEGKHFRPVLVVDIATRKKQAFYSIEDISGKNAGHHTGAWRCGRRSGSLRSSRTAHPAADSPSGCQDNCLSGSRQCC